MKMTDKKRKPFLVGAAEQLLLVPSMTAKKLFRLTKLTGRATSPTYGWV